MTKSSARAARASRVSLVAVLAGVLMIGGCMSAGTTPADDTASVEMKDVLITIQRTPCFGTCPVYTLSLTGDGVVTFTGERFTRVTGLATDTVPTDSVATLARQIMAAGYFSMNDSFLPGSDACGMHHTDAPTVITSVRVDTQSRRITNYHGCNGAPAKLREIEDAIDRVANTRQWLNQQ